MLDNVLLLVLSSSLSLPSSAPFLAVETETGAELAFAALW